MDDEGDAHNALPDADFVEPSDEIMDPPGAPMDSSEPTGAHEQQLTSELEEMAPRATGPSPSPDDAGARSNQKGGGANELLKLATIMDFGQDFQGSRARERKKPQEVLELEKAKEKEKEERAKEKVRLEEKRKQREVNRAEREAADEVDRAKVADEEEKAAVRAEKRRAAQAAKRAAGGGASSSAHDGDDEPKLPPPQKAAKSRKAAEEEKKEEKKEEKSSRRETEEQKQLVMERMQPLQQMLMLGFLPEEADLNVWSEFGTLTNGQIEIRESRVRKILGGYALGRGLFACRDFAQNELITVYGGELITTDEAKSRKDSKETQSRRYLMRISDSDFLVDGWQYAANISDEPSACMQTACACHRRGWRGWLGWVGWRGWRG